MATGPEKYGASYQFLEVRSKIIIRFSSRARLIFIMATKLPGQHQPASKIVHATNLRGGLVSSSSQENSDCQSKGPLHHDFFLLPAQQNVCSALSNHYCGRACLPACTTENRVSYTAMKGEHNLYFTGVMVWLTGYAGDDGGVCDAEAADAKDLELGVDHGPVAVGAHAAGAHNRVAAVQRLPDIPIHLCIGLCRELQMSATMQRLM